MLFFWKAFQFESRSFSCIVGHAFCINCSPPQILGNRNKSIIWWDIHNTDINLIINYSSLLALYQVACNQHYVEPEMKKERMIVINGGRHPLIEQTTTFVSNDIISTTRDNLINIIGGPNNCGKSTFIKQTALIVYMAHIGSYVPADSAMIGIMSSIYTKFLTCGSTSVESSSFAQDIRQVYYLYKVQFIT